MYTIFTPIELAHLRLFAKFSYGRSLAKQTPYKTPTTQFAIKIYS